MKNITTLFIILVLFSITSCDTLTTYTVSVSVERHPTLTIINNTGFQITLTSPTPTSLTNGARTMYQPPETSQNINVTYRIENIPFTETVTWDKKDATITLTKSPPSITVINNTGHPVTLSTPFSQSIPNVGRASSLINPDQNRNITVTYNINQFRFTEQATLTDTVVTVTLTRRPPTLTIVNNVGITVNTIFMRIPGASDWIGGNIVMNQGTVHIDAARGAQAGDISRSIISGDDVRIWMGNVPISGDRFDIRIDDVQGNSYVKRNVQITGDMSITFTQSDKPR